MEFYESYFDEDLDDSFSEDNDELFEDLDEADELGEDRASRRAKRQARRTGRQNRRQQRRDARRGITKAPNKPASTGAVQDAFENVGQDISKVQKEVKKAEIRQSNEQMNDIIASILFRPRLDTTQLGVISVDATTGKPSEGYIKDGKLVADKTRVVVYLNKDGQVVDKDGNATSDPNLAKAEVGYNFKDGLLALLAVKFIGNMKGVDTSKGFQQYLPLLAGVALSPSAQKDLGLGGILGSGNSGTGSSDSALSNLTKNPSILLLLLFLFMKK